MAPATSSIASVSVSASASETGCPPTLVRTLEWPSTRPREVASLPCPMGTVGMATWKCEDTATWRVGHPDLSQCESLWLGQVHEQLRRKESVVHLAKEMAHYSASNPLYGGDVSALTNAIGVMTEKMMYELAEIPTADQREAVVMEVVQGVIKTSSVMIEVG